MVPGGMVDSTDKYIETMTSKIVIRRLVLSPLPGGMTKLIHDVKMNKVDGIKVWTRKMFFKRRNCNVNPVTE